MLHLINTCNTHPSAQKIHIEDEDTGSLGWLGGVTEEDSDLHNALRAIVPGTLWCGAGRAADQFSHLGADFKLDRCCRAHDFCPMDLMRFTLQNPTPYTQNACLCDDIFFECL